MGSSSLSLVRACFCSKAIGFNGEHRISGLVVEYIVAIDVTRARFPADAYEQFSRVFAPHGVGAQKIFGGPTGSLNELRPLRFASHSGKTHTLRTQKHIFGCPTGSQNELRPLKFASHSGKTHTLRAQTHIFGCLTGSQDELRP